MTAFMPAQEATYLHASLYAFDEVARSEVVRRFGAAVNTDATTLNYRALTNTFLLQCPADRGAVADTALRHIIKDYIVSELEAAEQEDRAPHVVRFAESLFEELGAVGDGDVAPSVPVVHQPASQAPRTQIIMTPENEGRLVKLFRLHDLQSHGLLERALAPASTKSRRIMSQGVVCRAARWCNTNGYIFNGRIGSRHSDHPPATSAQLHLPPFQQLHDRREGIEPFLEESDKPDWSFVRGQEETTVKQWLQGTGDTRQEVPEARPEIPKDAKQYLASAQTHTTGRARVPKGQNMLPGNEIIEDSSSDSDTPRDTLASLLRPATETTASRTTEPDARSETSGRSAESDHAPFQDLLPGGDAKAIDLLDAGRRSVLQPTYASPPQKERALVMMPERSISTSRGDENQSLANASLHASSEWGDSNNEGFARVDTVGLTANAKRTAQWQNDNRFVLKSKKDKAKASDRLAYRKPAESGLLQLKHSEPEFRENQSPQRQTATSNSGATGAQYTGADATWSNYKDSRWTPVSAAPLIDIDMDHNNTNPDLTPVTVPPGFEFQPNRHTSPDSDAPREGPKLPNLIDDDVPATAGSEAAKILLQPQTPTDAENRATAVTSQQTSNDGAIVERIQPLPEGYATKYRTMLQKSGYNMKGGKKKKGKKSSEPKFKAQLELPDAVVPAPKAKQRKQEPPAQQSKPRMEDKSVASNPSRFKPSTRITRENHPFGKALQSERRKLQSHEDEDLVPVDRRPRLAARLGLLLVRPDENERDNVSGARDPLEMQSSLRETGLRTDFLPRLTTSVDDAATMLEIAASVGLTTSSQNSRVVLELIIQEGHSGTRLKVSVPVKDAQTDRIEYKVSTRDRTLAEASLHYAVHVWDAQISLVQPEGERGSALTSSIEELISSMNSDGEAPSFRAKVPKDACTVERVLAKRIFEIEKPGIVFRLSEVQDLALESMDLRDYNLRALAGSHDEMVTNQQYWWEAAWETADLGRADELQACVDDMVKQMDDVGLENKGPFIVCEEYRSEEEAEVVEQPFW